MVTFLNEPSNVSHQQWPSFFPFQALKISHAGISLSEAEASVASPFTSKVWNYILNYIYFCIYVRKVVCSFLIVDMLHYYQNTKLWCVNSMWFFKVTNSCKRLQSLTYWMHVALSVGLSIMEGANLEEQWSFHQLGYLVCATKNCIILESLFFLFLF